MEFESTPEKQEDDRIYLKVGKYKIDFNSGNGIGYKHESPDYDHIFVITEVSDDNECVAGYYLFRRFFEENGSDIDAVFEIMEEGECVVLEQEETQNVDILAYQHYLKGENVPYYVDGTQFDASEEPEPVLPNPEERWSPEYEARARKWGKYVAFRAELIANGEE